MAKKRILLATFLTVCILLLTVSCQELQELGSPSDSDGDGWSDTQEKIAGTDPSNADTDGDGYWDPQDPNPMDQNIPGDKGAPEPTSEQTPTPETPVVEPTATVTPEEVAEELRKVQIAVKIMMENNKLMLLANPVTVPSNDMRRFPDAGTRHGNAGVGYVLYCHDFDGNGRPDINYVHFSKTRGTYICDEYGNVTQVTAGYE